MPRASSQLEADHAELLGILATWPAADVAALLSEVRQGAPRPAYVRPGMLRGETYTPRHGKRRVYLTVNSDRGRVVEVWIDVRHKEGSILVGIGHAFARMISGVLQAQGPVPVEDVIRWLRGTTGAPAAVEDLEGVEHAESLPDLIALVLEAHMKERAT